MHVVRPVFALHPLRFGRGPVRVVEDLPQERSEFGEDLKLFAATFLAGFLFVSILIA